MLPDFKKAKDRANRLLIRWVRQEVPEVEPLLQGISTFVQHEGQAGTIVRQDASEDSFEFCSILTEFVQIRDEMKHFDPQALRKRILRVAEDLAQAQTRQMLRVAQEAAESVGSIVDIRGELTPDKFLEMLRRVEIDFDPKTLRPAAGTGLVMHPDTAAAVVPRMKQWEKNPSYTAEKEQIFAKKREDWRDREANRKLVD